MRIFILVIVFACAIGNCPLHSQTYTFSELVSTSTSIPNGNGTFTGFFGSFAFGPSAWEDEYSFDGTGSSGQRGVYYIDSTLTINLIADKNTAMPGAGSGFTDFGSTLFNRNWIFFRGYAASGNKVGLYQFDVNNSTLTTLLNWTTSIPSGNGNFLNITEPMRSLDMILYKVATCGSGPGGQMGIYAIDTNNGVVKLVDLDDVVPGTSTNFTNISFWMAMTSDTIVAFVGSSGTHKGIYMKIGSRWKTIVDTTTSIPSGTGHFTDFQGLAVEDSNVVFVGYGSDGQAGIYKLSGSALTMVANTSTGVPGRMFNFNNFAYSPLLENGVAVFNGYASGGFGGIFTDRGGTLSRVLATGDILLGDTVFGCGIYEHNMAFDGNGSFITQIDFTNGDVGLYKVSYVPQSYVSKVNECSGTLNKHCHIRPLPARSGEDVHVTIERSEVLSKWARYTVVNATNGQQHSAGMLMDESDADNEFVTYRIAASSLSPGVYYVHIEFEDGSALPVKFMIER
ncbi:MAG: hypothetical protein J5I53_00330 [Bradyrhizobiaceae bacterium]|nr:hypothetical protein [Bradyrhizobiaceae bacterium]